MCKLTHRKAGLRSAKEQFNQELINVFSRILTHLLFPYFFLLFYVCGGNLLYVDRQLLFISLGNFCFHFIIDFKDF